jgi:hypothetical protein
VPLLTALLLLPFPSTPQEPCYVASAWYPSRLCGLTDDQAVCLRGWGAYPTEDECCMPGEAHSEGCGAVLEGDDAAAA